VPGRPAIRIRGGPPAGTRNLTPGGFTVTLIICNGYLARTGGHGQSNASVISDRSRPELYGGREIARAVLLTA